MYVENGFISLVEGQERRYKEIEKLKTTISYLERDILPMACDIRQKSKSVMWGGKNLMIFSLIEVYDAIDVEDRKSLDKNDLNETFTHINERRWDTGHLSYCETFKKKTSSIRNSGQPRARMSDVAKNLCFFETVLGIEMDSGFPLVL